MGQFTAIPENTFKELQTEAGVILKSFDPAKPTLDKSAIICATTGGVKASCVPTFRDNGEDVDNCPPNMKELKEITSYECRLSFTALSITDESLRMSVGAADVTDGKVVPRHKIDQNKDFSDIWWVGDRSDGGLVAVCLKNAMSSDGFSLQTTKNGKGQLSVNMMGHYTITDQKKVPMEFYTASAPAEAAE